MAAHSVVPTLPGTDYTSPEVYELERERIFCQGWLYAGRADRLPAPGSWRTVDLVGESILLVHGRDGEIRGFYNVCRHRGARLCEEAEGRERRFLRCGYHAWGYDFDGALAVTPNVDAEEVDRASMGLWPVHVEIWAGGVFVSLSRQSPAPLRDYLARSYDDPLAFERFGLGDLQLGPITVCEVAANWKVVVENYQECLHCPTVHPELIEIIPTFRRGMVYDPGDGASEGVALAEGLVSLGGDPRSRLPYLPGMQDRDLGKYFGATVFPTMFLDIGGTEAIATGIYPQGPSSCTVVTEYLFHRDVDLSSDQVQAVVDFNELVVAQDNAVCERVQRGISSRAFTTGVLTEKDEYVRKFIDLYRAELGTAESGDRR
jgi:Rieske 2Fe-2S family protein